MDLLPREFEDCWMITCDQCGTENRTYARYCLQCGAPLEAPSDEGTVVEGTVVEDEPTGEESSPVAQEETGPDEMTEHRETGSEPVEPSQAEDGTESVVEAEIMEEEASQTEEPVALLEPPPPGWESDDQMARGQEETRSTEEIETLVAEIAGSGVDDQTSTGDDETNAIEVHPENSLEAPPLAMGLRLADRYEIVELVDETANTLIYDALDHGRCSQCGYGESEIGDAFCAQCGASLEGEREVPHIRLCALQLEGEAVIQLEDETDGGVESWFEWDGRLYATLPALREEEEESPAPVSRGWRHVVGCRSDPGLQRELDEDAILTLTLAPTFEGRTAPTLGLYAVADGMGGHEGGEIASRLAIEELAQMILRRLFLPEMTGEPVLPETPAELMRETIQLINTKISRLQQATGIDAGTTLTAALVRDGSALIANVGDSRTYLWRGGELRQITTDHSLVAQLVEAGAIAPDEIYSHPDKSAIYRSLGHAPDVEVDLFREELEPGDRLLLCCDGVWEMLRPDGIEEVMLMEPDPQRACDEIIRRSNWAGGEDNISTVIVQIEEIIDHR
jgi:serine/threonine protein phosphatase PrpC